MRACSRCWYPAEISVVASLHGPADGQVRDAVLRAVLGGWPPSDVGFALPTAYFSGEGVSGFRTYVPGDMSLVSRDIGRTGLRG